MHQSSEDLNFKQLIFSNVRLQLSLGNTKTKAKYYNASVHRVFVIVGAMGVWHPHNLGTWPMAPTDFEVFNTIGIQGFKFLKVA